MQLYSFCKQFQFIICKSVCETNKNLFSAINSSVRSSITGGNDAFFNFVFLNKRDSQQFVFISYLHFVTVVFQVVFFILRNKRCRHSRLIRGVQLRANELFFLFLTFLSFSFLPHTFFNLLNFTNDPSVVVNHDDNVLQVAKIDFFCCVRGSTNSKSRLLRRASQKNFFK